MQCQSLGPGEEGQMHSTNTTQTWTHSTHTEYTHSTPTLTATTTACLVIIHTDNGSYTPHRDTQTHALQAEFGLKERTQRQQSFPDG